MESSIARGLGPGLGDEGIDDLWFGELEGDRFSAA